MLDVKSFYLSYQQHLNQLEAAVEDMTYMIYLHVISVMTWGMLTLTDYWTWYRTIMGVSVLSVKIYWAWTVVEGGLRCISILYIQDEVQI